MSAVTDLERKVQLLESQLAVAAESLRLARLDEFPVKIGQTVRLTSGRRKGDLAKISNVQPFSSKSAWIYIKRFKKDGSLEARETFHGSDGLEVIA